MSITVQWDNEQRTIIRQTFTRGWTWEEFHDANAKQVPVMMSEVSHSVSIIVDLPKDGSLPGSGNPFSQGYAVFKNYPTNWGILVVVDKSSFVQALVDIFKRLYLTNTGRKIFASGSMDGAYQLIRDEVKE